MKTSHVSFHTSDALELPGLLYEPADTSDKVVVWLHGMGDSGVFYSPKRITALAENLTKQGIALLAFNNRGAHNSKVLYRDLPESPKSDRRYQAGTLYELIRDCVADIDGAAEFLQARGFTDMTLAGHSTGANKICVYDNLTTDNPFKRYVLAGPGDDVGLNFMSLGQSKFEKARHYAKAHIDGGQPLKVMPIYTGMHPFSAQSAYDILDPNGAYNTFPYYEAVNGKLGTKTLFKEFRKLAKPTLVIAGSEDEATASAGGAAPAFEIMKGYANGEHGAKEFYLVPDADHSFHGAETKFAQKVTAWLTS